MLSRVAECVYWMARYVERAENVARFVDVNQQLTLALHGSLTQQWEPLVSVTGDHEAFVERYGEATRENVIKFLAFDLEYPNSIQSCLRYARENARTVRENISTPMWEEINKAYLAVKEAARDPHILHSPYEFLARVRIASQTLVGLTETTMSHGEAWHFIRLGRLVERADKTSRILDVKYFILLPSPEEVGSPLDVVQWSALLNSASALEMYRKRFGRIRPRPVVDFLLFDPIFSRSVRFCLVRAERSLHAISGSAEGAYVNEAEKLLGRLRSQIEFTSVDEVFQRGLHEFVDDLQDQLNDVGAAIRKSFFAWAAEPEEEAPGPGVPRQGYAAEGVGQFQTQKQ
jgi:uncharacterized alpha-E superfamily protein